MRYVQVTYIEKGMKLARPLLGDNGKMLVKDGCELTDNIIKHINNMGLQGIYIDEPGFEDIEVNDVIPNELRQKAYEALVKEDYDTCVAVAKAMVKHMTGLRSIDMDLLDIKADKDYEYRHCISVALLSIAIGIYMKMPVEQLENLAVAGLLHDIGKFGVKKRVLNSRQIYGDKQMDEMKKHPMYSYEMLKDNPNISSVSRNSILFHHENIDGSGYYGISNDKLGLFPRILRVADTYDALTAKRKYRDAFSPEYSIEQLIEGAGSTYDKEVVKVFLQTFPIFPKAFTVELTNGEKGVIIDNKEDNYRPRIRLFDGKNINLNSDSAYKNITISKVL